MEDMNRVNIVGRCTRDPEVRGNSNVLAIRLAVTGRGQDPDSGEWGDQPNYFDVVMFGEKRVTPLSNILAKGSRIGIDGKLAWREWETSNGDKRQNVEINAFDIYLLDNKKEPDADSGDSNIPF